MRYLGSGRSVDQTCNFKPTKLIPAAIRRQTDGWPGKDQDNIENGSHPKEMRSRAPEIGHQRKDSCSQALTFCRSVSANFLKIKNTPVCLKPTPNKLLTYSFSKSAARFWLTEAVFDSGISVPTPLNSGPPPCHLVRNPFSSV